MTGDSDNEVGNPGDSPVPAEQPHPGGEPSYRPLRGWASAYQPEPSFWSRVSSGFARIFARKKKPEDAAVEDAAVEDAAAENEPLEVAEDASEPQELELAESPDQELVFISEAVVEAEEADQETGVEDADEAIAEEYHEAFDAAFDAPRSNIVLPEIPEAEAEPEPEPEPEPAAEQMSEADEEPAFQPPPVVREYQLRGDEEVDDLPVVREYELRGEEEEIPAEPQFIPARSLLDDEPAEKKPGFFARLFGLGKKKRVEESLADDVVEDEAVAEEVVLEEIVEEEEAIVEEEVEEEFVAEVSAAEPELWTAPAAEPVAPDPDTETEPEPDRAPAPVRLDRPSLEFFMRVDRAAASDATAGIDAAALDEALPMDVAPSEAPTEPFEPLEPPYEEEPTQPWIPVVPEPVAEEKKPGFFARLFGRKSKPVEAEIADAETADAEAIVESEVEGVEVAADEVYSAFDEPQAEPAVGQEFASVDDALPAEDAPVADDWSRFAPPAVEPAVESVPQTTEPFFFDAPAPPAGFDQPFSTLEVEAPPPVGDSRSTLEMTPVADAAPEPVYDGNMVELDLGSTLEEPQTDSRSTVQVQLDDEDTDTGQMVPPTPPEVTEAMEAERPPFFVPKFRAFYNEIVSHKHQKAEFTAGFATAVMDYTADLSPDAAAGQLQKRLSEILELQAAEATWMGGEAAARFPDAQYAMAALADELFAHIEWAGKDAWPRYLVEQKLFRSNAKDIEFFKRVDRLLKNESDRPSAAAKDLARMYLLVLAAGFQGKYRPFNLARPLAEYRRRLYEFVSGNDPLLLYGDERKLFPEAAERVVVGRAVSRFSMLQQWAAVLVILLIGYAVISQVAWNRVSADLKDVTARVEAANSTATSDGVAGDPR